MPGMTGFEMLKKLEIELVFLVKNKDIVDEMRLEYFDQYVEYYDVKKEKPENVTENCRFLSFKSVVEGDKIYKSSYHWEKKIDNSDKVVDNPLYWEELDHFYIYEQS